MSQCENNLTTDIIVSGVIPTDWAVGGTAARLGGRGGRFLKDLDSCCFEGRMLCLTLFNDISLWIKYYYSLCE